jgi:cyclic pyranopterin phosphate synthase
VVNLKKILSHVEDGKRPRMTDVSSKGATLRTAKARAIVDFPKAVALQLDLLDQSEKTEVNGPKGPIFQAAILAGIMAAKRTHELIPLCHPLPLHHVHITIQSVGKGRVEIQALCRTIHRTGVEMEALTAVSVAALTIYDMTKALSHQIVISSIQLLEKSGGRRRYEHHNT